MKVHNGARTGERLFPPGTLKAGIMNYPFLGSQDRLDICFICLFYLTAYHCQRHNKWGCGRSELGVNNDWAEEEGKKLSWKKDRQGILKDDRFKRRWKKKIKRGKVLRGNRGGEARFRAWPLSSVDRPEIERERLPLSSAASPWWQPV